MSMSPFTQSAHHDTKRSRGAVAASRAGEDDLRTLRSLRVLIVEDDVDSRDLLAQLLEDAGCVVYAAGSAREAFDAVEGFAPQVMISDIGMPEEDGYSLMRRVRAREEGEKGRRLPAVALTAFTSTNDQQHARDVGFDAHMGKPISVATLLPLVASLARTAQKS